MMALPMRALRWRPAGAMMATGLCAAGLGLATGPPPRTAPVAHSIRQLGARLLADEGWIMTGTGTPDPSAAYLSAVEADYLTTSNFSGQPTFDGYTFTALDTPEDFCPFVCVAGEPSQNFGQSLATGVAELNAKILPQLLAGDDVTVFGYSQSATIATIEMQDLIANAGKAGYPSLAELRDLHVVMIGDPNNPIGGMLDRLQFPDDNHVPFVNIPLSIDATPTADISSVIYTGEYDGFGDFPQDASNLLADINALIGIETVHGYYPQDSSAELSSAVDIGSLGTDKFYVIPENLPILQFMFNGGTAGQFFGDFFSPWLRLDIDWGYGNAGDPAVDGYYKIAAGPNINGSAYEQAVGVAGGSWAETPEGKLYDGSSVLGLFDKMDPLQMLAGTDNALIQSLVGPWADVAAAANGGTLSAGDLSTITSITGFLQEVTGYDLLNSLDHAMLTALGPSTADALFDGTDIPGNDGLLGLVGGIFDVFNVFGA